MMFRTVQQLAVQVFINALCCHAQKFWCDNILYKPLCPGTVAKCTCVVTGTTSSTRWSFVTPQNSLVCTTAIDLTQSGGEGSSCPVAMGTCGPYLAAANQVPAIAGDSCQTSVLNVTGNSGLSGVTAVCKDLQSGSQGILIGNVTMRAVGIPASPGEPQVIKLCTNSLMIQWSPVTSGDNATTYNISIISITGGISMETWSIDANMTVEDLVDGSNYRFKVVAINCAGSSNISSTEVWTLPCAPVGVNVTTVLYQNNSVHDVELFWTHRQNCSVPQYTVIVTSNTSTDMSAVSTSYCNTSSCSYVQNISEGNISSYTVSVACRNRLNQTGQPYVTIQSVPTPILGVGQLNVSGNTATLNCTFLDGSSYYCLVCCSSDPTVPVGSSGYISPTKGTSVSVSLQSLSSNQTYYCKAAATNTNTLNCGGPVVGGGKLFFSLTTTNSDLETTLQKQDTSNNSPISAAIGGVTGGVVCTIASIIAAIFLVLLWYKGYFRRLHDYRVMSLFSEVTTSPGSRAKEQLPPEYLELEKCRETSKLTELSLNENKPDIYESPATLKEEVKKEVALYACVENYIKSTDGQFEVASHTGHVYGLLQAPHVTSIAMEYEEPQNMIKDQDPAYYCTVEGKINHTTEPVTLDLYSTVQQKSMKNGTGVNEYVEVLPSSDKHSGNDVEKKYGEHL